MRERIRVLEVRDKRLDVRKNVQTLEVCGILEVRSKKIEVSRLVFLFPASYF